MVRLLFSSYFLFLLALGVIGQCAPSPDNKLPVININTRGKIIPSKERIPAVMKLTDAGHSNEIFIRISTRGSSSMRNPQKSYNIQVVDTAGNVKDVSLAGFPNENDFILYAPYSDKSLLRDVLTYELARKTGHYASRTRFAELYLNGKYEGVYVLEEKIKVDNARVPPASYILKIDRPSHSEKYWMSKQVASVPVTYLKSKHTLESILNTKPDTATANPHRIRSGYPPIHSRWQKIDFRFHDPGIQELNQQQIENIKNVIQNFEKALASPAFADPVSGYRKYADINSFIDFFILNEVTRNIDAYRLSTYLYILNGKIYMGPVWDFNLAMGNAGYCDAEKTNGWAYQFNEVCGNQQFLVPFWWERLLQDPYFKNALIARWAELRKDELSNSSVSHMIDSLQSELDTAPQRHYQKWFGDDKKSSGKCQTHDCEIEKLKSWLLQRIRWMDDNL